MSLQTDPNATKFQLTRTLAVYEMQGRHFTVERDESDKLQGWWYGFTGSSKPNVVEKSSDE